MESTEDLPCHGDVVVVYRCWNEAEAAVVVSFLEGNGIPALARTELPHGLFPVQVGKISEIRITVPSIDAERALQLLKEAEEGETSPDVSPES